MSVSRAKHLRKLHLVQAQQTQIMSRSKIEKRDKIEQIDALSFGEETPKLVDFTRCLNRYGVPNFFAFLLTRERVKSNGALKLITVKMRWAPNEELTKADDTSFEQEEETKLGPKLQQKEDRGSFHSKWKLKFDFVTSFVPKIENLKSDKYKPSYLNVIEAVAAAEQLSNDECDEDLGGGNSSHEPVVFYIHTGVGSQSVVFRRGYNEVAQPHPDEPSQRRQIEEARAALVQGNAKKSKKRGTVGQSEG